MNETENMECPVPCEKCGKWFDLHDGSPSNKWFPNIVICEKCGADEQAEIERDEEIEDLKLTIENAECDIKNARERLAELEITDFGNAVLFDDAQIARIRKIAGRFSGRPLNELIVDLCEKGEVY